MKVVLKDDLIVLYLNTYYFDNVRVKNKEDLEVYIKALLKTLNNKYSLEFNGFYDIDLYIDKNYGSILEIKKEELEYLDYFNNQLEINVKVICDSFLYDVDNMDKRYLNYMVGSNFYIKVDNEIDKIAMAQILEHTNHIIYGAKKKQIVKKAKIVR